MDKKIFISFLWVLGFSLVDLEPAWTQSTLEYGTLVSGVATAAAKARKGKAEGQSSGETQAGGETSEPGLVEGPVSRLQAETGSLISKGSGLLGQVGEGLRVQETLTPEDSGLKLGEMSETPSQDSTAEKKDPAKNKIFLKNGSVIEGAIVERTQDHIRVDADGIPVTYFNEEIDRIEEAPEKG